MRVIVFFRGATGERHFIGNLAALFEEVILLDSTVGFLLVMTAFFPPLPTTVPVADLQYLG